MPKSTDDSLFISSNFNICNDCIYFVKDSVFCSKGGLESFGEYVRMQCSRFSRGSYMVRISRRVYDRSLKAKKEQYLITKSVSQLKALRIKGILEDG